MRFGPESLDRVEGRILGHNVTDPEGRRLLRKGRRLDADDVALLRELGRRTVYVASPEPDDVDEDAAAERVTRAVVSPKAVRFSGPRTGRVNVHADARGVLRVDVDRLRVLNELDGVTLATLPHQSDVAEGRMIATTKILPYALPEEVVGRAESVGGEAPVLRLDPLPSRSVALLVHGTEGSREKTLSSFESALRQRLETLGSRLERVEFVGGSEEDAEENLAAALRRLVNEGHDLLILAGETAVQDRHDLSPRAVEKAGGQVLCYGAPVDPGNLLLLAELERTPVLGAPGCARSPKRNIVDLVLPRLLLGDRLERPDIVAMGHGGLLEDVPERPLPRSRL
jgi:molybdenum cofactor cytidylyltransferase